MAYDETTLRNACELGAWAVASAGAVVLGLACASELLRRAQRGAGLVALTDRLLPTASRRIAVAGLTLVSAATAFLLPATAHGDDDLRSWLTDQTTVSTTTTRVPIPVPPTTTSRVTTTTAPRRVATPPPTAPSAPSPPTPPRPGTVLRPSPTPGAVPAPEPPAAAAPRTTVPAPRPAPAAGTTHTVVAGDCLWSVAAAVLGRGATGRVIDRGWRAIYAANHDAVGPDPNLIHPGLVLVLPPLDPTP